MAFALAVCLVGIALLGFDVARKINEGATATGDAVQWTLSQTDVELLALQVAVEDAMRTDATGKTPGAQLAEVILRYDVFYSRVQALAQGELYTVLKNTPDFAANFRKLQDFLDSVTPVVDGPRAGLRAALPRISDEITQLRSDSRAMGLAGLRAFALRAEDKRLAMVGTLLSLAGLSIVFILTLLALVFALVRLDRTNRARAEEIAAAAARLRTIVAAAQDAVITLDTHGRIVAANAATERIFGYEMNKLNGAELGWLLFPASQKAQFAEALSHPDDAEAPAGPKRHHLQARARHGRVFPVELTVSATQNGAPRLIVAFLRDLTAEVESEAELVAARDKALAGERAKADLLMVMSHEVRTPLNGLLGTLDLLGRTRLSARQKNYLRILETSGELLLHHVNDVLDISRLDKGLMPISTAPMDLAALAREVIENQTAAAEAQGNRLVLHLPEDGRTKVVSDARLLKQVLLNLVGNAVKFTEDGTITLTISHMGPDGQTLFRVEDTGIGIPAKDLTRIFDDFVTLDASYARRRGGSGLGLGIASRIIDQLGGRLSAESTPGKGSSFRFAIFMPILENTAMVELPDSGDEPPADTTASAPEAGWTARTTGAEGRAEPSGRVPLDVLVIEDNAINREVVHDMLQSGGHRVTEAADGAEGMAKADGRRFDLILMDISMPRMDGLQATEALRAGDGPNRATPILALTAHALPEEHQRFLAHGMAGVLIKPFGLDALDAAIAQALDGTKGAGKKTAAPRPSGQRMPTSAPQQEPALRRLVPAFLAEGETAVARIAAMAGRNEAGEELRQQVHRLAGPAGLIGAAALAARLSRIESLLKTDQADRAAAEIADLPKLWQRTKRDLRAEAAKAENAPEPNSGRPPCLTAAPNRNIAAGLTCPRPGARADDQEFHRAWPCPLAGGGA